MEVELHALELNNTWALTHLPKGKKAIGSKSVFKVNFKLNGMVDKHKAKFVAKGYGKKPSIDFHDIFSHFPS